MKKDFKQNSVNLRENDRVLRINTVDMKNINLDSINNIINTSKGVVHFVRTSNKSQIFVLIIIRTLYFLGNHSLYIK